MNFGRQFERLDAVVGHLREEEVGRARRGPAARRPGPPRSVSQYHSAKIRKLVSQISTPDDDQLAARC